MAIDHSSLLEPLEVTGVDDRIRLAEQTMFQALFGAEAEEVIDANF